MSEPQRYVQVGWTLPTRLVGGAALSPEQVAGVRVRFWREDLIGTPVSSTDVPAHMRSITVGLIPRRWLFTVQAILHGGVEGEQSVPKLVVVPPGSPVGTPKAPSSVTLTLLPAS
jgi:hypothetical protein